MKTEGSTSRNRKIESSISNKKKKWSISPYFIAIPFILSGLISIISNPKSYSRSSNILPNKLSHSLPKHIASKIRSDPDTIDPVSTDYGNIFWEPSAAVLRPTSLDNIATLIKLSYNSSTPFTIAARGRGHSVWGQAMARGGVVVDMMSLRKHAKSSNNNGLGRAVIASAYDNYLGKYFHYADVGGNMLWIDVLRDTTKQGMSAVSWTDYLYLTVGGTLSNAGISGQTFRYGPQISNVHEMDVITGTGEFLTCSPSNNSDLFYGVLGGLGQFGIITRARIALEPAPKRLKLIRMLYNDFSTFTRDQERLISINGRKQRNALDYLEGQVITNQSSLDNWRSSFPASEHERIFSLVKEHEIIYFIEAVKHYDDLSRDSVDKDLEDLFVGLGHIPGFRFTEDMSYKKFLNRIRPEELQLQSQGLWDVPHPWLNLFISRSWMSDFKDGVFRNIVLKKNITNGIVLVYPMNRNKWDDRMSAAIPDEEVFYTVGFLQSSGFDDWQEFDQQNKQVLQYCEDAGMNVKQYLPQYYQTEEDWARHFGPKWRTFRERKMRFDPKMILSPGQRIFN